MQPVPGVYKASYQGCSGDTGHSYFFVFPVQVIAHTGCVFFLLYLYVKCNPYQIRPWWLQYLFGLIKVQCINSGFSRKWTSTNRLNINRHTGSCVTTTTDANKRRHWLAYCFECHMTVLPNPIPTCLREFRKDLTLRCSFRSETTKNGTRRARWAWWTVLGLQDAAL